MTLRLGILLLLISAAPVSAQSARPKPPVIKDRTWIQIPLDAFFLAKLETEGVAPAPEATRVELIERVTRRLIGTAPTKDDVAAFTASKDKRAYEKLVDRLVQTREFAKRFRNIGDILKKDDRDGGSSTAKEAASRAWLLIFGQPLADHPAALEWLAAEIAEPTVVNCCDLDNLPEAWDVRHLARVIAISAVFRQSAVNEPAQKRDPDNRLFSRGPAIQ